MSIIVCFYYFFYFHSSQWKEIKNFGYNENRTRALIQTTPLYHTSTHTRGRNKEQVMPSTLHAFDALDAGNQGRLPYLEKSIVLSPYKKGSVEQRNHFVRKSHPECSLKTLARLKICCAIKKTNKYREDKKRAVLSKEITWLAKSFDHVLPVHSGGKN